MNTYYHYPRKELWDDHAWDHRRSQLVPLTAWIGHENLAHHRIEALPQPERRTEGRFDPKANALTYPEVVDYWHNRGLHYHCTSMGANGWVAMIPNEHIGSKGYTRPMDTVITLVNADITDPNWCMYVVKRYEKQLNAAAENHFAMIFIVSNKFDDENEYISITQEAIVIFHLNYKRFYLNIEAATVAGKLLKDIEGFTYTEADGKTPTDPDAAALDFHGIPVLNASGRWQNKDSLFYKLIRGKGYSNMAYDYDQLINSAVGKKLAAAMALEYDYDDAEDPGLMAHWDSMGLRCEFHDFEGEQWVTFVPKDALENPQKKIPCVCIFQEVNRFDPHQAITGFACYYEFHEIAAQGECMLLYFAQESLDANDMLHDILKVAEQQYPIDRSRIYLTGHSHNGRFTAEYMRRHQPELAAIATLGNEPGQLSPEVTSGFFVVTDEQLDIQASCDTPLINISGFVERNSQFPLNMDAPHVRPGQWVALNTFEKRAHSWQRRLRSARCPMRTVEEIAATRFSSDLAERNIGVPADRTEVLTLDGSENYIVDIKNVDGRYHLRMVALGNMPHTPTPAMSQLSWAFMRQFARNLETGEIIEL